MPTDDTSTQGSDATAHQTQQDSQNADNAHSEQSTFDARKAFDATNQRVNQLTEKLASFDTAVITQIADKLGISKEEAKEKVRDQSPDVQQIAREAARSELWDTQNEERIAEADKDGKYSQYLKDGLKPAHALRLAEQDMGIQVDTSDQKRQQRNSAGDAGVDREAGDTGPFKAGQFGLTDADIAKYGPQAANIKVFR